MSTISVSGREQIILDPAEEIEDRVELNLHKGSLQVGEAGPDFGDAAVEVYKAKVDRGELSSGFSIPNRQIRIPMVAQTDAADMSLAEARLALQAKVARIQQEGGVLKREMADGSVYYFDLITASLKYGASTHAALDLVDTGVEIILEATPDFYGPEEELDEITGTGTVAEVLKKDGVPAVILGDLEARCRFEITEGSGNDQLGLIAALRCRNYSAEGTAALHYLAQDLTPLDMAADATVAGVAVVRHQNLATSWTPVLGTNLAGGDFLTHVGSYRPWALVYTTSAAPPKLRFVYDVGDLTLPAEGHAVPIPGVSNFYLVDLGEITLGRVPVGDHRWQGVLQAKGADGGENVSVADIDFQPLDECALTATGVIALGSPFTSYSGRDGFTQTSGDLDGKTADVGGPYTTSGGATDFALDTTNHRISRSTSAGSSARFACLAALAADSVTQIDVAVLAVGAGRGGPLARWVDSSHWLFSSITWGGGGTTINVVMNNGGTTDLGVVTVNDLTPYADYTRIQLVTFASGDWMVFAGRPGGTLQKVLSGWHSELATGGALASGKSGIYDTGTLGGERAYDNLRIWTPSRDSVLFGSRSAELSTAAATRESADGAGNGFMSALYGDLPRLPASGAEERPVEVFMRGSRGDLDQLPDPARDEKIIKPFYRPSWLQLPGS